MKITEETKIKDILPEGYEVVKTHQNIESIVIEMKRKKKDFDCYVEDYHNEIDRKFDYSYAKVTDPMKWPWELRIGLLVYISNDLNIHYIDVLDYLKNKYIVHLEGQCSMRVMPVVDICPEEFLKSLV